MTTLNVGGVLYTTTRSTLTKYPGSFLSTLLNTEFTKMVDGDLFKYVLNYLRYDSIDFHVEDFSNLDQLLKFMIEFNYYMIPIPDNSLRSILLLFDKLLNICTESQKGLNYSSDAFRYDVHRYDTFMTRLSQILIQSNVKIIKKGPFECTRSFISFSVCDLILLL